MCLSVCYCVRLYIHLFICSVCLYLSFYLYFLSRAAFEAAPAAPVRLNVSWPDHVLSLSHIALPFAPDDPLYGTIAPASGRRWLGDLSFRGERGVSALPDDYLLRMRYNPFFDYTLARTRNWLLKTQNPG